MSSKKDLIEVLIPTHFNHGPLIDEAHHQIFYNRVLLISDGLTISHPIVGYWNNGGLLEKEQVIFVRFTADQYEAKNIAVFAKEHYKQEVIMFYSLSKDVNYV